MFEKNLVVFNPKTYSDKFDVLADLSSLVSDKVTGTEEYMQAVSERETLLGTYVQYGVATPHAKTNSVKEPFVAYEKLEHGVAWGDNGEIANYIFMIGVPEEKGGNLHLKIISELSKSLMREPFREELFNAKSPEEVFGMLSIIEKEITK